MAGPDPSSGIEFKLQRHLHSGAVFTWRFNLDSHGKQSIHCGPVAQMDRVAGFEPVGREFESLWVRQKKQKQATHRHRFCGSSHLMVGCARNLFRDKQIELEVDSYGTTYIRKPSFSLPLPCC